MLDRYVAQVRLRLSVLPDITAETVFALEGGTARNAAARRIAALAMGRNRRLRCA